MRVPEEKIIGIDQIEKVANSLHEQKLKIVTTNGCFDLLHWGHIKYLSDARALGDILICAINSDSSVRRLKGNSRPLNSEKVRSLQVAGLEAVDYVVLFEELTPERILGFIRPDFHVKGGDYVLDELPERSVVEASGGKVLCLPLISGYSTTGLIESLKDFPNQ